MSDLARRRFSDFATHIPLTTRWSDNDMYGHLNNAKYYELFDTAINMWVATHTGADFVNKPVIGVVAESRCRFHAELAFPGPVTVGLRVERLGRTSVTYLLGLFGGAAPTAEAESAATGQWVHVYLDREANSSTPIPPELRTEMEGLQ